MIVAVNTRFLIAGQLEGYGRYIHEIMSRMVKAHPKDEFHFLFDRSPSQNFHYSDNVFFHKVLPSARHPLLFDIWYNWRIPKVLKKIKPDVFFSPDGFCSTTAKVATVMTVHDLAFLHYKKHNKPGNQKYYEKNMPKFVSKADIIIAVSDYTNRDLSRAFGNQGNKVVTIMNGFEKLNFSIDEKESQTIKNKYSDGKDYFIYVGAIHPRKNLIRLVKAFEDFLEKGNYDYNLIIAGRMAWNNKEFTEIIAQSKYQNRIKILGFVKDELKIKLISAAQAMVYVSLFEGFGFPVLESMGLKTPVICSHSSSLSEVAGNAAILVDPLSTEEISAAMREVILPDVADSLMEKGIVQVDKFSWDKCSEETYSLLSNCAKKDFSDLI